eukprot:2949011-Karenia_brevis.AAC.1
MAPWHMHQRNDNVARRSSSHIAHSSKQTGQSQPSWKPKGGISEFPVKMATHGKAARQRRRRQRQQPK